MNTKNFVSAILFLGAMTTSLVASAQENAPATPIDLQSKPTPQPRASVHGFLDGGYSHGSVFHIASSGLSAEAGAVLDLSPHFGMTFGLAGDFGKTDSLTRLSTHEVAGFATFEGLIFSRIRIGAGPQLSYFWMSSRAASSNGDIGATGMGLRARLSIDVIQFTDNNASSSRALFIAGSPNFEWLRGVDNPFRFKDGAIAWRANVAAGIRF